MEALLKIEFQQTKKSQKLEAINEEKRFSMFGCTKVSVHDIPIFDKFVLYGHVIVVVH